MERRRLSGEGRGGSWRKNGEVESEEREFEGPGGRSEKEFERGRGNRSVMQGWDEGNAIRWGARNEMEGIR